MSNGTDEKKDSEEEDGVGASPFSILAMLPGIAGDIAKIASSPEEGALRRMQAGQGVGSAALTGLGNQVARDIQSAQATGHGATRGLGGVGASERAAQQIANVGPALGMTAAREQALATHMLRQNRAAQIGSAANLGWKLTGGIGGAIANMVAARDQGEQGQLPDSELTRDPMGLREATEGLPEPVDKDAFVGPPAPTGQAPGVVEEMAQRGEMLPGEGVSPLPIAEDYIFPGEGGMMQQMGASPDAVPAQTPEQEQVERQRGAEERRKMQQAQMQNDLAIIKATSSALEPAPDAPLGTAILTPDPAAAPLDDGGIQEWIWGKYRDGEVDLQGVQDVLRMYGLPMEPPEWFQWAPGAG